VEDKRNAQLSARLRERIELEGALSFHDWMEAALYDEVDGYYRRAGLMRWGREGDYRTSPELSPLFASTFARFFAALYEEAGEPQSWTIMEAGGGAGHFAQGVLNSLAQSYPQLFTVTRYIFDETSDDSRARAEERLACFGSRVEYRNLFSESMTALEGGVIFANELLDAFPVHRVTVREGRFRELFVEMNDARDFIWTERQLSTPLLSQYLERLNVELAEGQVAEINLHAVEWLKRAATIFTRGYLVLVDYGAEASELYGMSLRPRGSLRAFNRHRFIEDILQEPGEHDITTTIDWTTVKRVLGEAGFEIVSFERQDRFLLRAGLLEELARMTRNAASEAESLSLSATAREMILPGGISESFQVLVARR
jgi:SAM-dependent MidA family methyltransferase